MGAQTFVLAGDPNQLPPTVKSQRAASQGLTHTLFDNILCGGVDQKLLDMQYRMHPLIAQFPSTAFYGGRVKDGEPGACCCVVCHPLLGGFGTSGASACG